MKSMMMEQAGDAARMAEMRNSYKILEERIILNCVAKRLRG
jgi:hypothetical protein